MDLLAYLDPALLPIPDQSHKGWVIKIEKVALGNKTKNFGHFLLSSDQTLYLQEKNCFVSKCTLIVEPLRKIKIRSNDLWIWGVKIIWMTWHFVRFHEIINQRDAEIFRFLSWQTHGYIQPNNLCSALSSFPSVMLPFRSLPIRSLMWVCTTGCQKTKPYLFCRIKCISGGNSDSFSSP